MNNQLLLRGLVLLVIALTFGVPSLTHKVGSFAHPGPGLFPLLVSALVAASGLVMLVRSRLERADPVTFKARNLLIVLAALIGFVVIAQHVDALAAIVYLVFVSSLAGSDYSIARNLKLCLVLIGIAFALHRLLGLNLTLF